MAFESGTAANIFDLFDRLTNFMTTVNGWQLWSNIDGYGHKDFVYRSSGSDGRKDIFIRQRIGQAEPFIGGRDQYDYGDGDTGFLNFFAYLYYPYEGDAYAGASEAGAFGPRLVHWNGYGSNLQMYHQDFLGQQPGGTPQIEYGTAAAQSDPPDTVLDPHSMERRRWSQMNVSAFGSAPNGWRFRPMVTDGKRYIYVGVTADSIIKRYSLARGGGAFSSSGAVVGSGETFASGSAIGDYLVFFENRTSRVPYLFSMSDTSAEGVKIINLNTGGITTESGPSWPTNLQAGGTTSQYARTATWDGKRYIYVLRGGSSDINNSYPCADWGRFDTWTNTWRTNTFPEDPEFRGIYTLSRDEYHLTFINKEISGYSYNRLYVFNSYEIYAMDLGDDGLPSASNPFWTAIDYPSSSDGFFNSSARVIMSRSGRLFLLPGYMRAPMGKYQQFASRSGAFRPMFYADFKPSYCTWYMSDSCGFPGYADQFHQVMMVDGYACRVETQIGSTNYMFIGDEDRIIVATEISGGWSVAYMGAFESVYDADPYAEVDEDVRAGPFRKIKLKHQSGNFVVGDKYFITGNNGPKVYKRYEPDGRTIPIANSESITVGAIGDDYIIASLNNNYNRGAKIAIDPQPVGVFFWELEKFQTTNVVNRLYDDSSGSDSPSAQTYTIPVSESLVNTIKPAYTNIQLTDCEISTGESEGNHIGRENRGRMKGIYTVGDNVGISPNEVIVVDKDAYKVLEIPGYTNKYLVIGPVE